jgi:hypothetical protein
MNTNQDDFAKDFGAVLITCLKMYDDVHFGDSFKLPIPELVTTEYDTHIQVNLVPKNQSDAHIVYKVLSDLSKSMCKPILLHVQKNEYSEGLEGTYVERGDSYFTGFA